MTRKITQEDLIRFIYKETTTQEHLWILDQIEQDRELKFELYQLLQTINLLNGLEYNPSHELLKLLNEEASSSSMEMS
jgi:hypothetical protein